MISAQPEKRMHATSAKRVLPGERIEAFKASHDFKIAASARDARKSARAGFRSARKTDRLRLLVSPALPAPRSVRGLV
jgi:hypothetical protein